MKTSGSAVCWGSNYDGKSSPPSTTFTQITAGANHSCGLKNNGRVECWGNDNYNRINSPADSFTQISAGENATCGIKTDGTGICWGYPSKSLGFIIQTDAYCSLNVDKTATCHSGNTTLGAFPNSGTYTYIAGGKSHVCALRSDGSVECWGNDYRGRSTVIIENL